MGFLYIIFDIMGGPTLVKTLFISINLLWQNPFAEKYSKDIDLPPLYHYFNPKNDENLLEI